MSTNNRTKRLKYNTISSLILQITTIICGFITPRLILESFGSEVNGLVNSVTQLLQIVGFLELGVGAVVKSSLYKPLSDKDDVAISKIITSADKFFKRLAVILFVYICALIVLFPYISNSSFDWSYTALLIVAMSVSSFAQYYFGIVDRLLLTANQYGYVQYNVQTVTLVLNTIVCIIFINLGASIHIVKLTTSIIYLIRPLILRLYVNQHYSIDRRITYTGEPIKQKWNGVAQHISAVVLDGTDNIILTIFSTLSNVSIYSVYYMVVSGIKQMFLSLTNGIQSLIGELWAKQELNELKKTFGWFEWTINTCIVFIFGCTGTLIVPFIQIYTNGINDADYIQPLFAFLLVCAHASHCLRLPYNTMILSSGHYKQTQNNYIIAALINIVLSIVTVKFFGLVGVAVGTLVAMMYQTVWMAIYVSKNLIQWPFKNFVKQISVDVVTVAVSSIICRFFVMDAVNYFSWIVLAIKTALVYGIVIVLINFIFYKDRIIGLVDKIRTLK